MTPREKVIDAGCSCDMQNGYVCGLHSALDEYDRSLKPIKAVFPVGVSVLVTFKNKLLLGRRITDDASHGLLSTPGGRLEENETFEQCAVRELREETGLIASEGDVRIFEIRKHFRFGKHYIMIYANVQRFSGAPENMEPTKCSGWAWYDAFPFSQCTEPLDVLAYLPIITYNTDHK